MHALLIYAQRHTFLQVLANQVAWVVGGVGPIGSGLARGLLRAGATVIVNSRYQNRLDTLSEELGHPEKLLCINETMVRTSP